MITLNNYQGWKLKINGDLTGCLKKKTPATWLYAEKTEKIDLQNVFILVHATEQPTIDIIQCEIVKLANSRNLHGFEVCKDEENRVYLVFGRYYERQTSQRLGLTIFLMGVGTLACSVNPILAGALINTGGSTFWDAYRKNGATFDVKENAKEALIGGAFAFVGGVAGRCITPIANLANRIPYVSKFTALVGGKMPGILKGALAKEAAKGAVCNVVPLVTIKALKREKATLSDVTATIAAGAIPTLTGACINRFSPPVTPMDPPRWYGQAVLKGSLSGGVGKFVQNLPKKEIQFKEILLAMGMGGMTSCAAAYAESKPFNKLLDNWHEVTNAFNQEMNRRLLDLIEQFKQLYGPDFSPKTWQELYNFLDSELLSLNERNRATLIAAKNAYNAAITKCSTDRQQFMDNIFSPFSEQIKNTTSVDFNLPFEAIHIQSSTNMRLNQSLVHFRPVAPVVHAPVAPAVAAPTTNDKLKRAENHLANLQRKHATARGEKKYRQSELIDVWKKRVEELG